MALHGFQEDDIHPPPMQCLIVHPVHTDLRATYLALRIAMHLKVVNVCIQANKALLGLSQRVLHYLADNSSFCEVDFTCARHEGTRIAFHTQVKLCFARTCTKLPLIG